MIIDNIALVGVDRSFENITRVDSVRTRDDEGKFAELVFCGIVGCSNTCVRDCRDGL